MMMKKIEQIDQELRKQAGRRVVVLGCLQGSSQERLEIEAFLSLWGAFGEPGLEAYPTFQVERHREQGEAQDIVAKLIECKADALLVPASLTDSEEFGNLVRKLKGSKELPPWFVKIDWQRDMLPSQVAFRLVQELTQNDMNQQPYKSGDQKESSQKKRGFFSRWLGR